MCCPTSCVEARGVNFRPPFLGLCSSGLPAPGSLLLVYSAPPVGPWPTTATIIGALRPYTLYSQFLSGLSSITLPLLTSLQPHFLPCDYCLRPLHGSFFTWNVRPPNVYMTHASKCYPPSEASMTNNKNCNTIHLSPFSDMFFCKALKPFNKCILHICLGLCPPIRMNISSMRTGVWGKFVHLHSQSS